LGKRLGGSTQSFVSKFERGERRLDLIELGRICKALKIDLYDFVHAFQNELGGQSLKRKGKKE